MILYGTLIITCRNAVWPELQEPRDDLSITLWDTRYLKQFGSAVRGLECIEANGSPVTFEVTGFTFSSKKSRANVRLLGIQSEKDGSLVLAVRKPYIPLFSDRQRVCNASGSADDSVGQIVSVVDKGKRSQELQDPLGGDYVPARKVDEVDVPLQRPMRLRGHVKIIRT